MKSVIIASDHSGGGKTTFSIGLMNLLKNKKIDVQAYKIGPDYIDTAFHKKITNKGSRNLDSFLMGDEGVRYNYCCGSGDVGIIEGVMGLYDGMGSTIKGSAYDVSRILGNMPIILVLSPKGVSLTICAMINGLKNFKNANIKGIVLNNVSEKYYNLLKYEIEENCSVQVLGYIPKDERISLKSRHLGLVQSSEIDDLKDKVYIISQLIEEHVDVDLLLDIMQEYNIKNSILDEQIKEFTEEVHKRKKNLKIGIAYDKAFSFYYEDNIKLLESLGDVIYFSPLNDEKLPENLDFLYIGGGYPEVFKEKLSGNISMRNSIREALENGLKCYAECGGLMYLTKSIDNYSMCGFFDGNSYMTDRLNNFGYCNVTMHLKDKEININAHEFHKSYVNIKLNNIYEIEKKQYDGSIRKYSCGYMKNNTVAAYPHINFLGNLEFLKYFILDFDNAY